MSYTDRITALMFATTVIAALVVDGLFSALNEIPAGPRPTRDDIFGSLADGAKALTATNDGRTYYFCSEHCRTQSLSDPDPFVHSNGWPAHAGATGRVHHG